MKTSRSREERHRRVPWWATDAKALASVRYLLGIGFMVDDFRWAEHEWGRAERSVLAPLEEASIFNPAHPSYIGQDAKGEKSPAVADARKQKEAVLRFHGLAKEYGVALDWGQEAQTLLDLDRQIV